MDKWTATQDPYVLRKDREQYLDACFKDSLPCKNCALAEVCKYSNSMQRANYNPAVFSITTTCKIKDNYTISRKDEQPCQK